MRLASGKFMRILIGGSFFILIILITILIADIVTPFIFSPYPNLENTDSHWITVRGVVPDSQFPKWTTTYYARDTTSDPYQIVYNWYEDNYPYDYLNPDGDRRSVSRRNVTRIPLIGVVRTYGFILVAECSPGPSTCVSTQLIFEIVFTGLLGEVVKLFNWSNPV